LLESVPKHIVTESLIGGNNTLELLESVPKHIVTESLIGGNNTLELLERLGLVFIFDDTDSLDTI